MSIGIAEITEKNLDEFVRRATIAQNANGAFMSKGGEDIWLKRDDLAEYIGFQTNASTKSKAQFNKFIIDCLASDEPGSRQ